MSADPMTLMATAALVNTGMQVLGVGQSGQPDQRQGSAGIAGGLGADPQQSIGDLFAGAGTSDPLQGSQVALPPVTPTNVGNTAVAAAPPTPAVTPQVGPPQGPVPGEAQGPPSSLAQPQAQPGQNPISWQEWLMFAPDALQAIEPYINQQQTTRQGNSFAPISSGGGARGAGAPAFGGGQQASPSLGQLLLGIQGVR